MAEAANQSPTSLGGLLISSLQVGAARPPLRTHGRGWAVPAAYWGGGFLGSFHWEYVYDSTGAHVTAPGGAINPSDEPVVALVEN